MLLNVFFLFHFFQAHLAGYKELAKDLEPDPDSEFDPEMARNVFRECYGGTFPLVVFCLRQSYLPLNEIAKLLIASSAVVLQILCFRGANVEHDAHFSEIYCCIFTTIHKFRWTFKGYKLALVFRT
jgi:hypothetical protein